MFLRLFTNVDISLILARHHRISYHPLRVSALYHSTIKKQQSIMVDDVYYKHLHLFELYI